MTYQEPPQYAQPVYKNPNKLDFGQVLFKPDGRIGRGQFWAGWGTIFGANIVLSLIPIIGTIVSLGLIYVQIVVYGKRLHDMGKTAWLQVVPMAATFILMMIGLFIMIPGIIALSEKYGDSEPPAEAVFAIMGPFFIFIVIGMLIGLGFLLWVGIAEGERGPNRYGPDPKEPFSGDASSTFS